MTFKELAERGDQLGNIVKPIALLFAVAAFLGISSPWLRRSWEEWTSPPAWYQIGTLHGPKTSVPYTTWESGPFESMIWKNGLHAKSLYDLIGHTIITNGLAYGHEERDASSDIGTVHRTDVCLYVNQLVLRPFRLLDPASFDPDVRQTQLSTTAWRANQNLLAQEIPADKTCVDISQDDLRKSLAAHKTLAEPVCPRIQVWVKARKVSC